MSRKLSNAVYRAAGTNAGFGIYGDVTTSAEYANGVVFNTPSEKPTWSSVQTELVAEDWADVRGKRDILLARCDWTQSPDSPLSESVKTAWETYRQSLRDVPQNNTDPNNISWPTAP